MESSKDSPESRLMKAIFGELEFGYYPYIVVEENGEKRVILIIEAIQKAFDALPHNGNRKMKALELRFGLSGNVPRTFNEIGRELGVTGSSVQQTVAKALRELRHPSRSKILRRFLIPSPKEISYLKKEIDHLRQENRSLDEKRQRLKKILERCGVSEEELEGVPRPEELVLTAEAIRKDKEALQALIDRFPKGSVWNAVRRNGVSGLAELTRLMKTGEIRSLKGIGEVKEQFLQMVLKTLEKEASP